MKRTPLTIALLAGLAFAGTSAFAHGDEDHGAKPADKGGAAHSHGHGDAIGVPGKADKASRTITVDMTDAMRFSPSSIDVKQGETIRLVVKNSGKLKHEMVLGTEKELKDHYEAMKKFPEMEHADPNMVTVQPGGTGEIVWRFTKAGKVDFACLQPGHYDAGMKGLVNVAAATKMAAATMPAAKADGHDDHKH